MSAPAVVSLDSIAESVDYGVTASASWDEIGPKFLRITDIQDGQVDWNLVPWCECSKRERLSAQLETGDIVFARTGATTGKSFLIRECPESVVFASYLIRVRLGSAALPSFVSHYFQSQDYWSQISSNVRGVAQPGVNATTLKSLRIPLPPLPEQRRIAAILDQADTLRTQRRAALAQLDSLTQSLFLDMFGDPVTNPKGWSDTLKLGEVADIVSGVTKGRSLEGKATRELPYMAVSNVQDKFLRLDTVKTIEATEEEVSKYRIKKDDLLLTEGGDPDKLGRGTLWNNELPECIHQNHVFRVRLTSAQLLPLFLNWLVGSQRGKDYFLRSAKQTTGIASINMTQLRGFPLLTPPLPLQQTFATRVQAIEALKAQHRAALAEADALFAALQQRAFAGGL